MLFNFKTQSITKNSLTKGWQNHLLRKLEYTHTYLIDKLLGKKNLEMTGKSGRVLYFTIVETECKTQAPNILQERVLFVS